jgi:O-antigen ligase
MLTSVFINILFGQAPLGIEVVITLVRYSYWWIVFLVVANVSSHEAWMRRIIVVLGISAIGLAGVRVLDAFLVGGWGLGSSGLSPQFLTKNSYGIQFSTFGPFAFVLPFVVDRKYRLFALIGALFLLIVILANGSRGNWVGLAAGGSVLVAIYSVTHSARGQWVWVLPLVVFMIVLQVPLPAQVEDVVTYQLDTFEDLDADKSYEFRQIMIQKALILFEKHPVFGVGLDQFKQTYVPELVLPPILQGHASSFITGSPHNSYLHYLAELGLVGTIPFALFLARLALRGTQAAIHFARKEEVWALGVLWSFVSMSVHLWSLAGLGSTQPWLVYGLVAGMVVQGQIPKRLEAAGGALPNNR